MELGIPGGFANEHHRRRPPEGMRACRAHGKFAAAGFVTDETLLRRYISMGRGTETAAAMRTYL